MLTRNGIYKFINSKRIPVNNGLLLNFYALTKPANANY